MTSITGQIGVGEANATLADIGARQRGPTWVFRALSVALSLAGASLVAGGAWLAHLGEAEGTQSTYLIGGSVLGAALGSLLYRPIAKRWVLPRFRDEFTRRALPLNLPYSLEVRPDALVYGVGEVTQSAKWPAVTDVFPSRDFGGEVAERAFLLEAFGHMTPEARERSPEATHFLNAKPATPP